MMLEQININICVSSREVKKCFISIRGILSAQTFFSNEKEKCILCVTTYWPLSQTFFNKSLLSSKPLSVLYPKCECGWIKKYRGAAKREAYQECDCSFRIIK
ncbi:hypothetical protein A0J61_07117 [Choanephora cucurbitarum]|uniref:Uncharacterized protein n=1 Tax=Choanephora cucurbitarum TaxID=101091 RepID=A0A1C7N6S1_9FUNG|nr:hypothetical protein A0J61_07117 [Choanephora cucurbitarum]